MEGLVGLAELGGLGQLGRRQIFYKMLPSVTDLLTMRRLKSHVLADLRATLEHYL